MTTQVQNIPLYESLSKSFDGFISQRGQQETADLIERRKSAFGRFQSMGFPTTQLEEWKYTNLLPFLKDQFETDCTKLYESADGLSLPEEAIIQGLDAYRLVLLNGQLIPSLSSLPPATEMLISRLSEARNEAAYTQYFSTNEILEKQHFGNLNTAMFSDGLFFEVKAKAVVEKPLHIIHLYHTSHNAFLQPRHLWVGRKGSMATLIESAVCLDTKATLLLNSVTEVVTEATANLTHYHVQSGGKNARLINNVVIRQERDSVYSNYTLTISDADLVRNNLQVRHEGEHLETNLFGLYLVNGSQLVDNHTLMDHRIPNCNSNEHYKGVLSGKGTGVFNGKVYVHVDAQKTNAFQQNNNLLLSDTATVYSKPQLEIFADDVKCSHGMTVGQFDEESMFYLRSRGIGEAAARTMLVHAFAFDITEKIKIPALRAHVDELIASHLPE
ncbi:Fe-S cluster assembly protein SufD [Chitinophaga horti]|uniref:Fe-S cluster assembly protein SufD n=1 Tax=Chitinophaga horti TaxID=2920382 RepID=A0ABY6J4T3_9BACT|nr:Fe-S cluster assembly protein SufD [Chitinophaga horti]UYQ94632.1 Fe-S cluster assembly protein SufD [Chitinophaga horti]